MKAIVKHACRFFPLFLLIFVFVGCSYYPRMDLKGAIFACSYNETTDSTEISIDIPYKNERYLKNSAMQITYELYRAGEMVYSDTTSMSFGQYHPTLDGPTYKHYWLTAEGKIDEVRVVSWDHDAPPSPGERYRGWWITAALLILAECTAYVLLVSKKQLRRRDLRRAIKRWKNADLRRRILLSVSFTALIIPGLWIAWAPTLILLCTVPIVRLLTLLCHPVLFCIGLIRKRGAKAEDPDTPDTESTSKEEEKNDNVSEF